MPSVTPLDEQQILAILRTSSSANLFRSAIFNSIRHAISPPYPPNDGVIPHRLPIFYVGNREYRYGVITVFLRGIRIRQPGDGLHLPSSVVAAINDVVNAAGELALECGIQHAELGLEMLPSFMDDDKGELWLPDGLVLYRCESTGQAAERGEGGVREETVRTVRIGQREAEVLGGIRWLKCKTSEPGGEQVVWS